MTPQRIRLGMLTPSSNTVLEPVTAAMLAEMPHVSAHFSRLAVLTISLEQASQSQFYHAPMLAAAQLLADARVHSICWNGTSAGWLGFERDKALCQAIAEGCGIPATSAVLGFNQAFHKMGIKRLGLVSPYVGEIEAGIIANYRAIGIDVVSSERLDISDNFAFSEIDEPTVAAMCREVAKAQPDGIAIYCTNVNGAELASELEQELGLPIFDSAAVAVWAGMRTAGAQLSPLRSWGRLFRHQ